MARTGYSTASATCLSWRRRPWCVARIIALAGAILAIWGTVVAWDIQDPYEGAVRSDSQQVGTCHEFQTEFEASSLSDVAPPVPCDQPHQTETYLVGELPEDAGTVDGERPGREATVALTRELCDGSQLAAYLGAEYYDEHWFVAAWPRVPTPQEWARGERMYRCDVSPSAEGQLPTMAQSMKDILRTRAGDDFRRCFDAVGVAVPCSREHVAESVRSWVPIPGDVDPAAIPQEWAERSCTPIVSEFLGRDVRRTDYRIQAVAYPDVTPAVAQCRLLVPAGAQPIIGSLSTTIREGEA
ncbi:septum formation family protein [Saccharomonospora sp. NPDC046836]|uniref:septum formation family protein n=1 Tax=Saccharomonospora sp. NPDC046836 TaxID=3156921 RepID=UPI0033F4796B